MRKKSPYKPRHVVYDTMGWVKSGMKRLVDMPSTMGDVRIANHGAMDALVKGIGDEQDSKCLANGLNMAFALCELGIGKDYRAQAGDALDALLEMTSAATGRGGRYVFTGSQIERINYALELHDAQLDICTVSDIEAAGNHVTKAIKGNKARGMETA